VAPLKSIAAEVVADTFVATWVARFGMPSIVTTDCGTQFTGSVWSCLCHTLGVCHITTKAYHPQSNGMVERFHGQLKEALRARSEGTCWLDHLPWVLLGLRTVPREEAGISSTEATLGIPLQLPGQPLPLDRPNVPPGEGLIPATTPTYADAAAGRLGMCLPQFVYVREGQARGPLSPTYSGPFRVIEQRGKAVKLELG